MISRGGRAAIASASQAFQGSTGLPALLKGCITFISMISRIQLLNRFTYRKNSWASPRSTNIYRTSPGVTPRPLQPRASQAHQLPPGSSSNHIVLREGRL
ncbi:hypothetical protein AXF42_Ash004261 [Apostasia shenzhenica]|uniref:Uncharacterized protein n=1 Tax=Apostasia shenzhenica TaxID=1088818 RepID=A0A2I0A2E9_9ASPA|nr:hypothetical protein AXF42_Ash004261 [Apostasia shenzhenica]